MAVVRLTGRELRRLRRQTELTCGIGNQAVKATVPLR